MKPSFSVVIPVYNGEKFLGRAIESVLSQRYPVRELIVVDDGSTDGTPDILRRFGDRLRSKRIPNSGGASRPRNVGIQMCSGDYIAFLDGDDFWFRHKLAVFAEAIQKYPDVGMISSDFMVHPDGCGGSLVRHTSLIKAIRGVRFNDPIKEDALNLLLRANIVGTPSAVVVKRSVFETVGFFRENCCMVEDLDFYLRAALSESFLLLSDVLFFKREHGGNITSDKIALYTSHQKLLADFYGANKKIFQDRKLIRTCHEAMAHQYYMIGNFHFESKRLRRSAVSYVQALQSSLTPRNFAVFLWTVFKKSLRLLSFNKLNRKSLGY